MSSWLDLSPSLGSFRILAPTHALSVLFFVTLSLSVSLSHTINLPYICCYKSHFYKKTSILLLLKSTFRLMSVVRFTISDITKKISQRNNNSTNNNNREIKIVMNYTHVDASFKLLIKEAEKTVLKLVSRVRQADKKANREQTNVIPFFKHFLFLPRVSSYFYL